MLTIIEESQERVQKELSENQKDAVVYFVSHWHLGTGFAIADGKINMNRPIYNAHGKGLITLGTDKIADLDAEMCLKQYAQTLMHEQCHLYGLYHMPFPETLMFPYADLNDKSLLDEASKKQLLAALADEDKPISSA